NVVQEDFPARLNYLLLARKEHHPHAIFSSSRQLKSQPLALFSKKIMGYLQQNPGAIAGLWIAPPTTTMLHILEHRQCVREDFIRTRSVYARNTSDTTGVMFQFWSVQAALGFLIHVFTLIL